MCKRKVRKFILLYFFISLNVLLLFFFINNQSKQRKTLKQLQIRSYSYQIKKAILSYEQCACFDSECQRIARWDDGPTSASLVSDEA